MSQAKSPSLFTQAKLARNTESDSLNSQGRQPVHRVDSQVSGISSSRVSASTEFRIGNLMRQFSEDAY